MKKTLEKKKVLYGWKLQKTAEKVL